MFAYNVRDPLEMAAKEYLPWVRALAAHRLRRLDLSQSRIARALGVTQPSVTLYLKKPEAYYLGRTSALGVPKEMVSAQAERYARASVAGTLESLSMALDIVSETLGGGALCEHHRGEAGLPEACDVCMRFFGTGGKDARSSVTRQLEEAVRLIESSNSFPLLIPEVQTNFVSALPEALDEHDVAGIPGRIACARGRAKAASPPDFGASRYTANIVLAVKRAFKEVGSGLNVKYDATLAEVASGLGWRSLSLAAGEADRGIVQFSKKITEAASRLEGPPDLLVESGGIGLEASAYVLGRTPGEVVEKALALAGLYSKRKRQPK